jgi:hypothetical protein
MSDRLRQRAGGLVLALLLAAGHAAAAPANASLTRAPLLDGMDGMVFDIDTSNALARRYAGQGVLLVYGFNPAEAARSLEAALALDPACATCAWALAWSLGPNINADMDPQDGPRVQRALAQARRHALHAPPVQRALIAALSLRHPIAGGLDEASYAERMQAIARLYPKDGDVAVLAAEALLNLHPYDWWQQDGKPQPWTPQIETLLQRAMALQPGHAGAHHYWIHLQESSAQPDRARASANALRDAVPGSGHLLHMPSHIDMRTGHFDAAITASQRSIEADGRYLAQVDAQGSYRVGYVAHNHHFLWAAASMAGRESLALQAAQAAWPAACGPAGQDPGSAIAQHYAVLPYFTRVRFGQWEALLRDTLPPDGAQPYPQAIWHYARGTALARSGQLPDARRELAQLQRLAADPALRSVKLKNINATVRLPRIAELTLQADLALAEGAPQVAVARLREATAIEDALEYDEPHLWLAPTRHALGAALLAAGQPGQALQVYGDDLRHYPNNGWSLGGLSLAFEQLANPVAAQQAALRAEAAFDRAERRPNGSRF